MQQIKKVNQTSAWVSEPTAHSCLKSGVTEPKTEPLKELSISKACAGNSCLTSLGKYRYLAPSRPIACVQSKVDKRKAK